MSDSCYGRRDKRLPLDFTRIALLQSIIINVLWGHHLNAIAPGIILTELIYREAKDPEKLIEEKSKMAALGRSGNSQDIANLALFLSADESAFITGQVIASNGGQTGIT